jgi:pyruvate,orthophosphate dikinase
MQDIEFTIQDGRLFMLQTRSGKRSGIAHVVIACDIHKEGKISLEEALMRIPAEAMEEFLLPTFDDNEVRKAKGEGRFYGKGLPAGKAAAVGRVVFDAETAINWAQRKGERVILVRNETTPDDVGGMSVSQGILTALGGMTSHAALVARGMGKSCIVGAKGLSINYEKKEATIGEKKFREGDWISLHGQMGEYYEGQLHPKDSEVMQVLSGDMKAEDSEVFPYFQWTMEKADKLRRLGIRTNADTPNDSRRARLLGAEGIGLTRTEHMFFEQDRIPKVQQMILSETEKSRRAALDKLLPLQQGDFEGIFKAMDGLPVTIRLLDPPLHEFLPDVNEKDKIASLANDMNISIDKLKEIIENLHELNPMLGHRGCRLSITFPEIAEMQVAAIIGAACECKKRGIDAKPEIMVPLIGHANELNYLEPITRRVAKETMEQYGIEVDYLVGTMIEIPRAALTADDVAKTAEFFSFGTNDLTQMTFGFSRDDIGGFLYDYLEKGILPKDPFQAIDQTGVGQLVEVAVERGRKTRSDLKLGICGEHGGEPSSIDFCHRTGLDYVSCSPFRVPTARLAAAQAVIREK